MLFDLLYQFKEKNQSENPVFTNPSIKIEENKRATLCSLSGISCIRKLIEKLDIAKRIDQNLKILKMHKPYMESDHILNFVYNFLTGGDAINDIERLQTDEGFLKIIGAERVPDPTTAGDFLVRFSRDSINQFQEIIDSIQEDALALLPEWKKQTATIDADSSIHEVYGAKKEGADYSYNKAYSYNAYYMTLMETGDVLYQDLRSGNTYSSEGTSEQLPKVIERLKNHFQNIIFRGDSAFYDKNIARICDEQHSEFFITADQTARLMNEVVNIDEGSWYPFVCKEDKKQVKRRRRRKNNKACVMRKYGKKPQKIISEEIASFNYRPTGWDKEYRIVVKRTKIEEDQLYLDEALCKYRYYCVIANSKRTDRNVMKILQKRGNQENLIKDFKYGLSLSHIPTGFLNANIMYFKIAALAWNIKTWFLNLIKVGSGAIVRFKRFLVDWIFKAAIIAKDGNNRIIIRMDRGEYLSRYNKAFNKICEL
jgi:hypothetical protein